MHKVAIDDAEGRTWFREDSPVLDLGDLVAAETKVRAQNGAYQVLMAVREPRQAHLRDWSSERIGGFLGLVVDGKLHSVAKLMEPVSDALALTARMSEQQAEGLAKTIRGGGRAEAS